MARAFEFEFDENRKTQLARDLISAPTQSQTSKPF
jgi:hypothetical protein